MANRGIWTATLREAKQCRLLGGDCPAIGQLERISQKADVSRYDKDIRACKKTIGECSCKCRPYYLLEYALFTNALNHMLSSGRRKYE